MVREIIKKIGYKVIRYFIPEIAILKKKLFWGLIDSGIENSKISSKSLLQIPYYLKNSTVDDYTYISIQSSISYTQIGKFCSIGPNFISGWGVHPTTGLSTSPMFYSTLKQNGTTLCNENKIDEHKISKIGNDVFIGANVIMLDGVTIGDGAIIGAGSVVSKNIPAFAIAVGCPIKIIKYRFEPEQIDKLLKIKWWNFMDDKLQDVEKMFFDVNVFIEKYSYMIELGLDRLDENFE